MEIYKYLLLLLFLNSCRVVDNQSFTYHKLQKLNNLQKMRLNGYYVCTFDLESQPFNVDSEYDRLECYVFYENGFFLNTFESCTSRYDSCDYISYYVEGFKRWRDAPALKNNETLWGAYLIDGDTLRLQKFEILKYSIKIKIGIVEKKAIIVNDSTFRMKIPVIGKKKKQKDFTFRFIKILPKPDSTNWIMEKK